MMSIKKIEGRAVHPNRTTYQWSRNLVEYIASKVPNFYFLIENMRINGCTIALAREIEKIFGKGSFREIFTTQANEQDAKNMLEKLKQKVNQ